MEVDFAFLDSGTGGVPYMLDLKKKSPESSCVYLGDTENFPYGEKSARQVSECATRAVQKIISLWNPKVLVIACNTISVGALSELRKKFPELPIVGTVPAIKIAAQKTRNGRIGLLPCFYAWRRRASFVCRARTFLFHARTENCSRLSSNKFFQAKKLRHDNFGLHAFHSRCK